MDTEEDQGKKKVTVFFGTQTRTVEGFAKALAEEAKARYPNAIFKLVDIDEYATEDDEYKENLKRRAWLCSSWLRMEMASLLIMLPDSTNGLQRGKREEPGWKIFNLVAVVVDELLHEQGAKHIVQVGLGDDDQGIEDDFSAWRELLWPELDKLLQDENETGRDALYKDNLKIVLVRIFQSMKSISNTTCVSSRANVAQAVGVARSSAAPHYAASFRLCPSAGSRFICALALSPESWITSDQWRGRSHSIQWLLVLVTTVNLSSDPSFEVKFCAVVGQSLHTVAIGSCNDGEFEFTNLKYSRVEIDEVRFEWAECMLDYI
ncbi:hypothetical protein ZIOFF_017211 [Zingiber officinale]|uniref:Flavodoxin-like domain-containing protein n=1 Tax=Zingiber officinale TaxID=94328 RepID=A0A8J5HIR9_ZINOF|nr:hypothetical protein ZIOFF_017211 [Zingiber officinale]